MIITSTFRDILFFVGILKKYNHEISSEFPILKDIIILFIDGW